MRRRTPARPRVRAWLAVGALLLTAGGAAPAAGAGPVRDPYWGTALFELYQDRRHAALVDLMVSQVQQRLPVHGDEAEVLRGGLLLDLGLDLEAERALHALLARHAEPSVHDRAWFHIARLRHRKGQPEAAMAALDRIGAALPAALRDDHALLRAQLRLALGDPAGAAQALSLVDATSPALPYARFNLAIAQLRLGEGAAGREILTTLGALRTDEEALRALRDRANLALGTLALRDGDPQQARDALQRVRLQGPSSESALLALGWAALQGRDHGQAVAAFDELAQRPSGSTAVEEARLARAHARWEAGAPAAALGAYEDAVQAYRREAEALVAERARWRESAWIDRLLAADPAPGFAAAPQPGTLEPALLGWWSVLAGHPWHEAWVRLSDLDVARRWLDGAQQQLPILQAMLAQRQAAFLRREPQLRAQAQSRAADDRADRLAALQQAWQQAAADDDGLAYATAREQRLAETVERARAQLDGLPPAQAEAARERLRLAQGVLAWESVRAMPLRHAPAGRTLAEARQAADEADQRLRRIAEAQRTEPARLQALAARIERLRGAMAALAPQVAALAVAQRAEVQALLDQALQQRQAQVAAQLEQARWSVAQVNDALRAAADGTAALAAPGKGVDDAPR